MLALWDFAWSSQNQPRIARIHAKKNKKISAICVIRGEKFTSWYTHHAKSQRPNQIKLGVLCAFAVNFLLNKTTNIYKDTT